jgi:hypothetical protein
MNMARRIKLHAHDRMGELLKAIEGGRGANLTREGREGALQTLTRTSAARDAGLSEHQQKTAIRARAYARICRKQP